MLWSIVLPPRGRWPKNLIIISCLAGIMPLLRRRTCGAVASSLRPPYLQASTRRAQRGTAATNVKKASRFLQDGLVIQRPRIRGGTETPCKSLPQNTAMRLGEYFPGLTDWSLRSATWTPWPKLTTTPRWKSSSGAWDSVGRGRDAPLPSLLSLVHSDHFTARSPLTRRYVSGSPSRT